MRKIIYTSPEDNRLNIVTPVSKPDLEKDLGELTEEQYEQHVLERSITPDALNIRTINDEDLPISREFRNAWADNGRQIYIDLEKARLTHMQRIRYMRDLKLSVLDKELNRAIEQDKTEEVAIIKAEKQRLRDIPQQFDLSIANNAEELRTLWPDNLDRHPIYKE